MKVVGPFGGLAMGQRRGAMMDYEEFDDQLRSLYEPIGDTEVTAGVMTVY